MRSIECVDDLPFHKTSTLIAVTIWRLSGELANKSFLSTPPHKSVDAIDTTDQEIVPFLHEAEIQCLHKAHGTFPCLGMASPLPPFSMEVSAVIGGNVVKPRAELMMLWRLKR